MRRYRGRDDDGARKSKIWQLRLRGGQSIGGVEWAPPRRARAGAGWRAGGRLRGRSEKKMDEVALRRRWRRRRRDATAVRPVWWTYANRQKNGPDARCASNVGKGEVALGRARSPLRQATRQTQKSQR